VADLRLVPDLVGRCLDREAEVEKVARALKDTSHCLYLGRGINMPIAYEGALKLKEISYIHAEGYPAGEMKHGPIALIDQDMPVVVIAPRDPWYDKMISQIEQAKARGGTVVAVATEGDELVRDGRPCAVGARNALAAQPGGDGHPAAAAGLSHRRPARPGCGPAQEPGEECDGGVTGLAWMQRHRCSR
jgi:fructoselysine-6-P-deglycase FrlB-like protein